MTSRETSCNPFKFKTEEITLELRAVLEPQLRLDSNAQENKIQTWDGQTAITLLFSEGGCRYELVLSNSFIQLYPSGLSSDVKKALSYLGEYLRCAENGRLLLTSKHAYEQWDNNTLMT